MHSVLEDQVPQNVEVVCYEPSGPQLHVPVTDGKYNFKEQKHSDSVVNLQAVTKGHAPRRN